MRKCRLPVDNSTLGLAGESIRSGRQCVTDFGEIGRLWVEFLLKWKAPAHESSWSGKLLGKFLKWKTPGKVPAEELTRFDSFICRNVHKSLRHCELDFLSRFFGGYVIFFPFPWVPSHLTLFSVQLFFHYTFPSTWSIPNTENWIAETWVNGLTTNLDVPTKNVSSLKLLLEMFYVAVGGISRKDSIFWSSMPNSESLMFLGECGFRNRSPRVTNGPWLSCMIRDLCGLGFNIRCKSVSGPSWMRLAKSPRNSFPSRTDFSRLNPLPEWDSSQDGRDLKTTRHLVRILVHFGIITAVAQLERRCLQNLCKK